MIVSRWRRWSKSILSSFFLFRSADEVKNEDSGPKISSVSGANRKRKWEEDDDDEEEQKAEESSDVDTSSDEAEDEQEDEVSNTTDMSECKETSSVCQETKHEVKVEQDGEKEKKISDQEKVQKKPSEPAIFIPVDRSPEVQVST